MKLVGYVIRAGMKVGKIAEKIHNPRLPLGSVNFILYFEGS